MSTPTFSIITPVYNGAATIARTMESVLQQNEPVAEYTIIDGASTDETVRIAEEYREKFEQAGTAFRMISEPDHGIYDAMNKGIRQSTGDLVGIINSDDWYEKNTTEIMGELYRRTRFDMAYADIRMHNGDSTFIKRAKNPRFVSTRHWNHPTTFVRREIYERKTYACESVFDDLDFLLWIHRNGCHIETVNEVLANFTMGGASNNEKKPMQVLHRIGMKRKIYRKYGYGILYTLDAAAIETAKAILGKT